MRDLAKIRVRLTFLVSGGDFQAEGGAVVAGIGAGATFGERVLFALVLAGFADFRAILAHQVVEFAVTRQEGGRQPTEIGTIGIQRETVGETAAFGFLAAGGGTALAGFGTGQAGIDAGLMGFS